MNIDLTIIFILLSLFSSGAQDAEWNEIYSQSQLENAGIPLAAKNLTLS